MRDSHLSKCVVCQASAEDSTKRARVHMAHSDAATAVRPDDLYLGGDCDLAISQLLQPHTQSHAICHFFAMSCYVESCCLF